MSEQVSAFGTYIPLIKPENYENCYVSSVSESLLCAYYGCNNGVHTEHSARFFDSHDFFRFVCDIVVTALPQIGAIQDSENHRHYTLSGVGNQHNYAILLPHRHAD